MTSHLIKSNSSLDIFMFSVRGLDMMAKTMLYPLNWLRNNICIFILMITIRFAVSWPPATECILDFPPDYDSGCIDGDWGGFLHKNCCGSAFPGYLYALGLRANGTGLIYLNSSEQMSCLAEMKSFDAHAFRCGIKKLTSGGGGCSDFSVADVTNRLGDKLVSLTENCDLEGPDGEWEQLCGSCVKSWQDIGATHSKSNINKHRKNETDAEFCKTETHTCRFAVLIALTSSRIDNKDYIRRLHKCLGEKNMKTDSAESEAAAPESKRKAKFSTGAWILIGVLIGIALITIATSIASRRCLKSKLPPKKNSFKDQRLEDSCCPKFPIKEVYSATKNLSEKNLIGEGTAGKVYKGTLSNNQRVAIKHIINDGNVETVVREVTSLSHIRHPNLVALLGYSVREDECFLIYELCPNGNLSEWIFGKDKILSWNRRLEIAIDSARGLWFLHTYAEGCIVHRDIKPTNILLGPNFEAKLSDFGLSKVINLGETFMSSEVRGTFGYVDPEYQNNNKVNSSGDVYSFGIVLLQILSGKRVINMNRKKPMPLDKMAKSLIRGGSIMEFADPKLDGEYSAEAFNLTFQLALSCTSLNQQRPSMEQVVVKLEEALVISTRAKSSTPETTPNRFSTS